HNRRQGSWESCPRPRTALSARPHDQPHVGPVASRPQPYPVDPLAIFLDVLAAFILEDRTGNAVHKRALAHDPTPHGLFPFTPRCSRRRRSLAEGMPQTGGRTSCPPIHHLGVGEGMDDSFNRLVGGGQLLLARQPVDEAPGDLDRLPPSWGQVKVPNAPAT